MLSVKCINGYYSNWIDMQKLLAVGKMYKQWDMLMFCNECDASHIMYVHIYITLHLHYIYMCVPWYAESAS